MVSVKLGEAPQCCPTFVPDSEQVEPEAISMEEGIKLLKRVMDNLGKVPQEEDALREAVKSCDDGDGKLNEKEFLQILSLHGLLSAVPSSATPGLGHSG